MSFAMPMPMTNPPTDDPAHSSGATARQVTAAAPGPALTDAPQPEFPRYSTVPFPSYRFVPGRNPHPTADLRGHSYLPPGRPHPRPAPLIPERWNESQDLLYGIDLYNHGYWWEAHEAWEGLWRLTDNSGAIGRGLQGWIQVSACHLKILLGHRTGAERLAHSSLAHLEFVLGRLGGEVFLGVELQTWRDRVAEYFAARLASDVLRHGFRGYPFLRPALVAG